MAKRIIWLVVVVLILGVFGYYFMGRKGSTVTTPSAPTPSADITPPVTEVPPVVSPTPPVVAAPEPVVVSLEHFQFAPAAVTVKAGTKVIWKNNDRAVHTVTSDVGQVLSSMQLPVGGSYEYTFATPGTYQYHCSIHPSMQGSVVVTE